jgi:hypothetical protein
LQTLEDFADWLEENNAGHALLVICGDWDAAQLLPRQCCYHGIPVPPWAKSWLNVKTLFRQAFPETAGRRSGLSEMLGAVGLAFEGRPHSGIDDTRNIVRLVQAIIQTGVSISAVVPDTASGHSDNSLDDVFAGFDTHPDKEEAERLEFRALDLARRNPDTLVKFADAPQSQVREAVAFISGRLLREGVATDQCEALLEQLRHDPDSWVRKKAYRALRGY